MPEVVEMYVAAAGIVAVLTVLTAAFGRFVLRRFPLAGWTAVGVFVFAGIAPMLEIPLRLPWLSPVGMVLALAPMYLVMFVTEVSGPTAVGWSVVVGLWLGLRSRGKFFSSSVFGPALVLGVVLAGGILFFNGEEFLPAPPAAERVNVFLDGQGPLQPMELDSDETERREGL